MIVATLEHKMLITQTFTRYAVTVSVSLGTTTSIELIISLLATVDLGTCLTTIASP